MAVVDHRGPMSQLRNLPREALNVVGTALAIFLTVVVGSTIASVLPEDPSPWLFAGCYAAPAAVMFAIYWFIAQRL